MLDQNSHLWKAFLACHAQKSLPKPLPLYLCSVPAKTKVTNTFEGDMQMLSLSLRQLEVWDQGIGKDVARFACKMSFWCKICWRGVFHVLLNVTSRHLEWWDDNVKQILAMGLFSFTASVKSRRDCPQITWRRPNWCSSTPGTQAPACSRCTSQMWNLTGVSHLSW